jgi:4a-hydroxytetrahydrobiopterin dehydratase
MTPALSAERCVACRSDAPPLGDADVGRLRGEVPDWDVVERDGIRCLERVFTFPDFAHALAFTNGVGALAEAEGHHPALLTEWGRVTVTWWTHAIRGLHRNDFVMAAKVDALAAGPRPGSSAEAGAASSDLPTSPS